jgi:hypothetical protein
MMMTVSMKTVSFQEIKLIMLMVTSSQNLSKLLSRLRRIVLEVDAPYQQHNIFKLG